MPRRIASFRVLGATTIVVAAVACNIGNLASDIASAIACGLVGGTIDSAVESTATKQPDGAYLSKLDGGWYADIYQTVPTGWLHLSVLLPLEDGDLGGASPDGGCPPNAGYYHQGGQLYPIDGQITVNHQPAEVGGTLDFELAQITYATGDGGTTSLPDQHVAFELQAAQSP